MLYIRFFIHILMLNIRFFIRTCCLFKSQNDELESTARLQIVSELIAIDANGIIHFKWCHMESISI